MEHDINEEHDPKFYSSMDLKREKSVTSFVSDDKIFLFLILLLLLLDFVIVNISKDFLLKKLKTIFKEKVIYIFEYLVLFFHNFNRNKMFEKC